MSKGLHVPALLFVSFLCAASASCLVGADPATRVDLAAPSLDAFPPVGLYLIHRCGSLDCHGSSGRNLRLYGRDGLRLDAMDVPGSGPTTSDELSADYRSIVGLEPEVMSAVVKDQGKDPERLTFIRKARGVESHTGGALILPGDNQDKCVVSWLAGSVDMDACVKALQTP